MMNALFGKLIVEEGVCYEKTYKATADVKSLITLYI